MQSDLEITRRILVRRAIIQSERSKSVDPIPSAGFGDRIICRISIITGNFYCRGVEKRRAVVANAPNEIMNSTVSGIRWLYASRNYRFAVSSVSYFAPSYPGTRGIREGQKRTEEEEEDRERNEGFAEGKKREREREGETWKRDGEDETWGRCNENVFVWRLRVELYGISAPVSLLVSTIFVNCTLWMMNFERWEHGANRAYFRDNMIHLAKEIRSFLNSNISVEIRGFLFYPKSCGRELYLIFTIES